MDLFEILQNALFSLAMFVGLSAVYYIIFKTRIKGKFLSLILAKSGFFIRLLIILYPLYYLISNLPNFNEKWKVLEYLGHFNHFLAFVILIEIAAIILFDYLIYGKKQFDVPLLFKDIFKGILYLIFIMYFLNSALQINITPLLTTSAIFSIILGLALQDSLGNLFSGLTLHLSQPYRVGEWIKCGTYEGEVIKINWRATTIRTFTDDYIMIPNSNLSKSEIQNYSIPYQRHATYIEVPVAYKHPPHRILSLLREITTTTAGVLRDPEPAFVLKRFTPYAIIYKIKIWVDNFTNAGSIESAVLENVWYRFSREGIEMPYPTQNLYLLKPESQTHRLKKITQSLENIDFLKDLTEENFEYLSLCAKNQIFNKGEMIVRQGHPGHNFYIIETGTVEVTIKNERGEILFTHELFPDECFGEMSLLTGEPRSATVRAKTETKVLVLEKEDFKELLKNNPDLYDKISHILAERKIRTEKSVKEHADKAAVVLTEEDNQQVESLSRQILNHIRDFFSF